MPLVLLRVSICRTVCLVLIWRRSRAGIVRTREITSHSYFHRTKIFKHILFSSLPFFVIANGVGDRKAALSRSTELHGRVCSNLRETPR